MLRILHLDSSARFDRSHTRRLTQAVVDRLLESNPHAEISYRDLSLDPPPHVTQEWIVAAFSPPEARTAEMNDALKLSDSLVDELLRANILVFGIPMYNFSVPSSFKAYLDQIVRVGRTFAFEPEDRDSPYKPLVHGKKLFLVSASGDGGYGLGERNEHWNHLDPFLKTVFGFIGITDITTVSVENDEFGGKRLADSLQAALCSVSQIFRATA